MGIADSMKSIAEDIIASYDARVKAHGDLVAATRKTLKSFAQDRKKMAEELKKRLKEFAEAHTEMSEALKKELAKYVAGIVSETKKLLSGFAAEREKMAANWQDLTAKMAKKRGILPKVEAAVEVKPVEEVVKRPKRKKKR